MPRLFFHLLCLCLAALAGCERQAAAPPPAPPSETVTYEARGVLREIRANAHRALIAHEAIPGYMDAMIMEFEVAEPRDLGELHPGDPITFRLVVTPKHGWIEQVRLRPGARVPIVPAVSAAETVLTAGDLLPDAALVDQAGRAFRLRDLQGHPLAFTFIFTRCPFPDYCPRLNAQFAAVQRTLAPGGAQLLSISIDPTYDTPARLAEYSTRFRPDPAVWRFATGEPVEIQRLGAAFGLVVMPENGTLTHNLRTVVVDSTGRIQRIFAGNEWTPDALADELRAAAPR